jgi:hypothetical protein
MLRVDGLLLGWTHGASQALTLEEQAGLRIFRQKGNCVSCHVGPNLTHERLHNTGIAWGGQGFVADRGAGGGDFKTPTLRDITRTAPYMHDGSIATLAGVIDFYDGGGRPNPALDVRIRSRRSVMCRATGGSTHHASAGPCRSARAVRHPLPWNRAPLGGPGLARTG